MPLVSLADLNGPDFQELYKRAQSLSTGYDRFITKARENNRLPGIHASEVAGCKRKMVYGLLAYEKRDLINKNWTQRFKAGHAFHDMLQRDFSKMAEESNGYMAFEYETVISPDLQPLAKKWFINSSTDGIFTFFDEPGGPPVLRVGLEIKTEAPAGYDSLKGPKPEHLDQAHVYMACLDLPLLWFFYINKGNQNNTNSDGPFLITFDQRRWAALEAKFQVCHDLAEAGELPPREESMVCEFCSFSYTCQPTILLRGTRKVQAPWRP